ncbi:MAG: cysteine desulfurase [Proteobacteria bacterium]|nr:cysteine desulfurase [Pseudomonadota bacterium]
MRSTIVGKAQAPQLKLPFDVDKIRNEFPILGETVNGHRLVYLDNAATTHKPQVVIDTISRYYEAQNSNIHRGVHTLSQRGTDAFENARQIVQKFINAPTPSEIIFTRGTTDSINLASQCLAQLVLNAGDEILVSESEHHSNIVPWQMVAAQYGANLIVAPIDDTGEIVIEEFEKRLNAKTKIVSIGHISNALGTINPVREMTRRAHAIGAKVLIDGAQSIAHIGVDVQDLECDLYAFSGHKVFAPTGIGVLYGKRELLEAMPPYQGGGDMIKEVRFEHTEYNDVPYKFEAGTPHIAGAIGLGAALEYLSTIDFRAALAHEDELLNYVSERLNDIDGVRMIGTARDKAAVASFVIDKIHPQDVGLLLDSQGIAVRTGHHCAMPVMQHFGIPGTVRASLSIYNTRHEIDYFIDALLKAKSMLA